MSDDELIVASAAFIVMSTLAKKRRKRRWWMTQLYQDRLLTRGPAFIQQLMEEEKDGHFKNFVRMTSIDFTYLLESIIEKISRTTTNYRQAVTPEERLAITLRFLATGDSYTNMKYVFNVSKQLTLIIVPEVCKALIEMLINHVQVPSSAKEWIKIADIFNEKWNFPNCLGAIDGKHVTLQCPLNTGIVFYNYKSFFSIVLMAIVDADYNFIFVHIGCQGGVSDGGVFKNCKFYKDLEENKLNLPLPIPLPNTTTEMPYVFLGDEAFALSNTLMKPYSGINPKGSKERFFNYRLSRARRVSENAFGIISAVFRVLRKPMLLEPKKAELVVMAIICLHNFLRQSHSSKNIYTPEGMFDRECDGEVISGTWRSNYAKNSTSGLQNLRKIPRKSSTFANHNRERFANYFLSDGCSIAG